MTLIVGVKCSNGVVIGADSAATFQSADGLRTIRNEHVKKIQILDGKIIMGAAGAVAIGQRVAPLLSDIWHRRIKLSNNQVCPIVGDLPAHEASDFIRRVLFDRVYGVEAQAAQLAHGAGWNNVSMEPMSTTMIALPVKSGPALYTFNAVGLPEEVTESLFCINIGNGQAIADPFMGLLSRVLWDDRMPTVEQAMLGVVWCLTHAISLHPGGVGGQVQVTAIAKRGGRWDAFEATDDDLKEHRENVAVAEKLLRDWHSGKLPVAPPPPIPTPGG